MRSDATRRFQPLLDAIVADAEHDRGNQTPTRRAQIDRPRRPGRLLPDSCQRFLAGPVVRQFSSRVEDGAVDLAKSRAPVDDPGLRGGHEYQRRGVGRIWDERCSAGDEPQAHGGADRY